MIRFEPKKSTELPGDFCKDRNALGYIGYDMSDSDAECGFCIFKMNDYTMEVVFVEAKDNDKEVAEGLIRSALNYGANRNAYIAEYSANDYIDVAECLGFSEKDGKRSGEIPDLLAGSCCKKDRKY